jgi:hypothetical protein
MLVWVASYPRSGNTLGMLTLRDIFGLTQLGTVHREHLGLDGLPHLPPNAAREPYEIPPELADLPNEELVTAIGERPEPFFIKTHRPADADDPAPGLYIVRDGRDALVSQARRLNDVGTPGFRELPFNRGLSKLIESGTRAFGDWSRHVRAWRTRDATTALIRFEELVVDPGPVIAGGCGQLGLAMPDPSGELTPFVAARAHNPVEFRRGEVGSWREEMPPRLQTRFWRRHGEEMEALGYRR